MHVARQIAPHVASVNASIEQRGEQRFQPHVERFVERHASECESTTTASNVFYLPFLNLIGNLSYRCLLRTVRFVEAKHGDLHDRHARLLNTCIGLIPVSTSQP